jgi:hypothetical protein
MKRGRGRLVVIGGALLLAGCASTPPPALPDPTVLAPHEWVHGAPWGPEQQPWVPPPPAAYGGWGMGPWWPGYSIGGGYLVGRSLWLRGGHRGAWRGGGGHHGGRH